jgi:hypothetical protein
VICQNCDSLEHKGYHDNACPQINKHIKRHSVAEAEEFLRLNAKVLVVGTLDNFREQPLDALDPRKTYLMAFVEVE